jgi:hypothetical protein
MTNSHNLVPLKFRSFSEGASTRDMPAGTGHGVSEW